MTQEKTKEELEASVRYWMLEYDNQRRLNQEVSTNNLRLAQLLDEEHNRGPKLTTKQGIMLNLVINSVGVFPHVFNAAKRWDRAEELYEEGVKRGHFPKG